MRQIRNWYKLLEGTGLVAYDSGPGLANGTLAANVTWCPYYPPALGDLLLSGTLSPNASGYFHLVGGHEYQPYYHNPAGFFLWWDSSDSYWYISILFADKGSAWFYRDNTDPLGDYAPGGTATGTGTISTVSHTDHKGVTLALAPAGISSAAAGGLNPATGSFEMLIRPTWHYTDALIHYFWDTYGGSNTRFRLYKDTDGTTILFVNSTYKGAFTFPWATYTLYHIVFNWPAGTFYVNNVLVKTFSTGTLGTPATNLFIGSFYSSSFYPMSGTIYYFITRDVPLTAAEIAQFKAFFQNQYIPQIT